MYAYVGGDPVSYVDPAGLWAIQIGGAVSALFPTLGGAGESGVAISYSRANGLQIAGYQSAQARAGVGIFGGFSLNLTVTPGAKRVSDLNGPSFGGGFDTPIFGISLQFSEINGKKSPSFSLGIGPGYIGDVYGSATYTSVGESVGIGGSCPVH